jgi:hypothetical protein
VLTWVVGLVVVGGALAAVAVLRFGGLHQPATKAAGDGRGPTRGGGRTRPMSTRRQLNARGLRVKWWQRVRSGVFLAALAVMLGMLLATVVGLTVVIGVLLLRQAIG